MRVLCGSQAFTNASRNLGPISHNLRPRWQVDRWLMTSSTNSCFLKVLPILVGTILESLTSTNQLNWAWNLQFFKMFRDCVQKLYILQLIKNEKHILFRPFSAELTNIKARNGSWWMRLQRLLDNGDKWHTYETLWRQI